MSAAQIEALGDCALLIRFGDRIDARANVLALAAAELLVRTGLPGLLDVAPAYATVCVRYDPLAWDGEDQSPFGALRARVGPLLDTLDGAPSLQVPASLEIPVCYGGAHGPDLAELARRAQLTIDEAIALHCAGDYRVAMLGFAPGFPYLLGLDARLHAPRHANPRTRVPAGSIAIGGGQTGIYPRATPGGWRVIGRTPVVLFDSARPSPALLTPGQRVRFRAIDADELAEDLP
jgi:KipI family sensor histidine kinase inhibitor